ncbi:hypothetical protein BC349_01940 [Flavihumibacter stibioxidans]|uniref:FAD:protein FMN transferase n=1 Tax=Flavihumibacter stibioxidans TaxID=1834163 RepID=A0ABR7M5B1_9BACT|nr:hypothetical protein [Flavihumibacter stibioxidans]
MFIIFWLISINNSYAQPKRYSFTEPKMGAPFTIVLYAADSSTAASVSEDCFHLVDSLVLIFSDYIDSSELNRLCAAAGKNNPPFPVSPALFDILKISARAYNLSNGSFDITLGPLSRLWRRARKENSWPPADTVKATLALTGFHKVQLDTVTRMVILTQPGMQLDLGGIAQGYIAQKVTERIRLYGIGNALVNVSGDIVTIGAPPGKEGWTVAINAPRSEEEFLPQNLLITNKAVTTSGDIYQYILHNGKKYSHVINPKTGYGITSQRNVTVIANDGTTADWLTKAISLMPLRQARRLAKQLNAEFLIAEMKRGELVYHSSESFNNFWKSIAQ